MIKYLITLILLILSTNLYAGSHEHEHEEHREHDAHVHGLAELTLAQEGQLLEINLQSPAANIVGFEHKASTEKQKHAVKEAKAMLESPQQLFTFHGARCDITKTTIDVAALLNHNHDKNHAYDEPQASHSEITAHYQFTCKQGLKLKTISVELLEKLPGIEKLKTQWITDTKQGAVTLNHDSKIIRLR